MEYTPCSKIMEKKMGTAILYSRGNIGFIEVIP